MDAIARGQGQMPRQELGLWRRATGARTNGLGKAGAAKAFRRAGLPPEMGLSGKSERRSGGFPGGSHPSGHGRRWLAPRRDPRPTRTGGSCGREGLAASPRRLRRFPAPGRARGKALSSSPAFVSPGGRQHQALRRVPEMPAVGSSVTTWFTRSPHTAHWVLRAHDIT